MEDPTDIDDADDTPLPPRPWSVAVASLATGALGLIESRHALGVIGAARDVAPPVPTDFLTAVQYAQWLLAQDHRRAVVAVEVARLVMASFLFGAAARVFVRAKASGWVWRQAIAGNVLVSLAVAWRDRALLGAWAGAFDRALALAPHAIPSPNKQVGVRELFRIGASASTWLTVVYAAVLLGALVFATRKRTREHTG